MSDQEFPSAVGAVAPVWLTQWQRITNTFTAPSKTFEDIKRGNRSWWMPFVIIAVVSYILFAVVVVKIGMQQVVDNQIQLESEGGREDGSRPPPEQREMSHQDLSVHYRGHIHRQSGLHAGRVAVLSLGLWGTINFVFGGKANFGSIFAVWMYAESAVESSKLCWGLW